MPLTFLSFRSMGCWVFCKHAHYTFSVWKCWLSLCITTVSCHLPGDSSCDSLSLKSWEGITSHDITSAISSPLSTLPSLRMDETVTGPAITRAGRQWENNLVSWIHFLVGDTEAQRRASKHRLWMETTLWLSGLWIFFKKTSQMVKLICQASGHCLQMKCLLKQNKTTPHFLACCFCSFTTGNKIGKTGCGGFHGFLF